MNAGSPAGRRGRARALAAMLLAAAACVAPGVGHAQLRDCSSIRGGPEYLVVLGDVTPVTGTDAASATIARVLKSKLKNTEESLRLNTEVQKVRIAVCPGRHPRDDTEFDARTVDQLSRLNVVLEIWGDIIPGAGPQDRTAELSAAAIVLLRFEPNRSGIFQISYPRGTPSGSGTSADVLLNDPVELEALATLVIGRRYQQDGRLEAAARAYCQARTHLQRAERLAPAAEAATWAELRAFVDQALARVSADARADPARRSALDVLPPGASACPG